MGMRLGPIGGAGKGTAARLMRPTKAMLGAVVRDMKRRTKRRALCVDVWGPVGIYLFQRSLVPVPKSWDFPALWIVLASLRRCCAERGSAATETTDLAVAGLKTARTR